MLPYGTDLTWLLDRRDRRSHDSALQSTPCRFAPEGRIPSPRGEGGFGIGQTWAIPKTDEGTMSQIFAWFPLISQRLVPRPLPASPPKGKLWYLRRGSKKRTQAYGFSSGLCALTWRFSAGTSFGFGQPQHTARTDNIQTCSSRSPP